MAWIEYTSPMGTLWLRGRDGVLTDLSFAPPREISPEDPEDLAPVTAWLDAYFRGDALPPCPALAPEGTAFQQLIWNMLLDIPRGQTRTYGDLAREAARILGKETMSAQSVGQAVGKNPIAILIPCHRVLGSGGKLTGYAYGLERKKWLLDHEKNHQEVTP